jgi:hypothetical protein
MGGTSFASRRRQLSAVAPPREFRPGANEATVPFAGPNLQLRLWQALSNMLAGGCPFETAAPDICLDANIG